MRRAVVTGIGAVTPVGHDAHSSFLALVQGQSGVRPVSFPVTDEYETRIAGEVQDFDPSRWMNVREARRQARFTQFAMCAAQQALDESGLKQAGYASERIATVIGAGLGGVEIFAEAVSALNARGPRKVSPLAAVSLYPNIAPAMVSMLAEARGPCFSVTSACASSAHALGEGLRMIQRGDVDAVIAGGGEAAVTPVGMAAFTRMRALSTRNDEPSRASRPFDRDRDGFVMAEGGAMLVLEELEHAQKRGARIYGELAGYGASADAFHVTQPREDGIGPRLAMQGALRDAGLAPERIDYINAHGTSTPHNDLVETRAIKQVFGSHAAALWISSTKSMTGHMMGAGGAFEAIVGLLSMQHRVVPPTLNLENPGEECDLDYVPGQARERPVRSVLSNSFGFGGQNVALVLTAV
jgi:3-oxoacyl-[acyl-carrier-protein] synthase II